MAVAATDRQWRRDRHRSTGEFLSAIGVLVDSGQHRRITNGHYGSGSVGGE